MPKATVLEIGHHGRSEAVTASILFCVDDVPGTVLTFLCYLHNLIHVAAHHWHFYSQFKGGKTDAEVCPAEEAVMLGFEPGQTHTPARASPLHGGRGVSVVHVDSAFLMELVQNKIMKEAVGPRRLSPSFTVTKEAVYTCLPLCVSEPTDSRKAPLTSR